MLASMQPSLPLLLLLAKATIILLTALAVTLGMQRASAGARHMVWLVTLATLLLVPAMTAWGPVRLAVLPAAPAPRAAAPRDAVAPAPVAPSAADAATTSVGEIARIAAPAGTPAGDGGVSGLLSRSFDTPARIALAIWAAVMAVIVASLGWSALAVRRIVTHASPLDDESWRTPLYEVADRMGLPDAPRLLGSGEVRMPFACGIITPTIVLPASCESWSLARRRAVLLHELAHVRRHDLLGHTLGRLACAAYWFHPLVWSAAKQLRNESERACDDLALSCGTRATDYAEHLLEIVTSVRKDATPSVALAMARRKEFEGRMLAILDPELRRSAPTRRQSAALIGSLALVALTVGAVSPVARTAQAAQIPTATASRSQDSVRREAPPVSRADARIANAPRIVDYRADTALSVTATTRETSTRTFAQAVGTIAGTTAEATVGAVFEALGAKVKASAQGDDVSATARASRDTRRQVRDALAAMNAQERAQPKDERARLLAKVLASDTSAALRRVAAWGLHEYAGEPVAIDALAGALRRDADAAVREMAAWSLGEGDEHNPAATEALAAALRSDRDEKVRATAAWAMGQVGDRGAVDALVSALSSGSAAVRTRALWAIGNVEPRSAPREVVGLLRDPEPRVRILAAWALFNIEDPSSAGALQDALKAERDKEVQLAEIRAIGALGEKSVDALKALVESSDPRMRSMAVHALAGGSAAGPWPWPWPDPRPFP